MIGAEAIPPLSFGNTMLVEIYGYATCYACVMARKLLDRRGYNYVYRDIKTDPAAKAEMLARAPGVTTVPQIFVDKRHIGGFEEFEEAERQNIIQQIIGGQ